MSKTTGHTIPLTGAEMMWHAGCPACGGEGATVFKRRQYSGTAIVHHLCGACGLVYMNPIPRQAWYDRLYREEFWEVKAQSAAAPSARRNLSYWTKAIARAEKFSDVLAAHADARSIGAILEVGAAYGIIGRFLGDRFNARVFAVEPNDTARSFAAEMCGATLVGRGLSDIATWRPERPIDLVLFSHVLENIVDLEATFATVRRLMRPGGYLLIETPNIRVQTAASLYHPYCFGKASLSRILARHGFTVVFAATGGRPATTLSDRYLTVLATNSAPALSPPPREKPWVGLRTRLGQAWHLTAAMGPLRMVDAVLTRRAYPLSAEGRALLTRLRESSAPAS